MPAKHVTFGAESRTKLIKGVNILADAVRTTLGPRGRNVIIQKSFGGPVVTKDGVTVAKEVELEDVLENLGAQMVKEAASRTASKAGDGTTTATVLAQAIVTEGMKYVTAGLNPIEIKRGIDKAVFAIVEQLDFISKPCHTSQEIAQVASISANSDETIGDIIAEALDKVGKNGAVTVESGKGLKDQLTVVNGMQFDRGYISAYFSTNHESLTTELEECFILLYDKKISHIQPLIPVLEQVAKSGKPILVVAEDVEGDALQTLLMNNSNGSLKVCAIPAPGFSDRRLPILEDIAILTGATVFSKELCRDLSDIRIEHLGVADRIEVTNLFTTIIGGRGKKEVIEERINHIKYQIEQETDNDYNVDKLKDRLAKLDGGVALIKVGAATEVELKEKKDRYDDALHATRAAVDEGIVPGGGIALLRAKQRIEKIETNNPDQEAGVKIILNAIESPIRQIITNAGKSPDVIIARILSEMENFGYDASCDKYGDMIELGIIDPTKVTKTALVNAASVAGLLLTSDCAITEIPERKAPVNREEFYF